MQCAVGGLGEPSVGWLDVGLKRNQEENKIQTAHLILCW